MVSHPQLLESVTYVLKFSTVAYATWADKWADISLGTFLWDIICLVNDVMMVGGSAAPQWIGCWSPQQERDEELYCASLLALFKPWRVLEDLHVLGISFNTYLVSFLALAGDKVSDLVDNIRYSHCVGH
jgi:hypothetical protein